MSKGNEEQNNPGVGERLAAEASDLASGLWRRSRTQPQVIVEANGAPVAAVPPVGNNGVARANAIVEQIISDHNSAIATKATQSTTLQETTGNSPLRSSESKEVVCVKCGHDEMVNGKCRHINIIEDIGSSVCGCKCEFPNSVSTEAGSVTPSAEIWAAAIAIVDQSLDSADAIARLEEQRVGAVSQPTAEYVRGLKDAAKIIMQLRSESKVPQARVACVFLESEILALIPTGEDEEKKSG